MNSVDEVFHSLWLSALSCISFRVDNQAVHWWPDWRETHHHKPERLLPRGAAIKAEEEVFHRDPCRRGAEHPEENKRPKDRRHEPRHSAQAQPNEQHEEYKRPDRGETVNLLCRIGNDPFLVDVQVFHHGGNRVAETRVSGWKSIPP